MYGPRMLACIIGLLLNATVSPAAPLDLTPKAQLGKSLFFDENLSMNQNQSCASCHAPEAGWTGPDLEVNAGVTVYQGSVAGRFGNRKPSSAAYATPSPVLHVVIEDDEPLFIGGNFWDGRATGEKLGNPAADQAQAPFLNPVEQALPDAACIVYRVSKAVYAGPYTQVWGGDISTIGFPPDIDTRCREEGVSIALHPEQRAKVDTAYNHIALSLAAYEASFEVNAFTSKFDFYLQGKVQLTEQETIGLELFRGKAKCANCHPLEPGPNGGPPLFTDFTYDNLGVSQNPKNPALISQPDFIDSGLHGFLLTRPEYARFAQENKGKQKVPTLRNVDKRPADTFVKSYMHNGVFKSLEEVTHFYNTRDVLPACTRNPTDQPGKNCWPAPEVPQNVNRDELGNLGLSPEEETAIVAFMKTLTDGFNLDNTGRSKY